jgi:hypothetical protein
MPPVKCDSTLFVDHLFAARLLLGYNRPTNVVYLSSAESGCFLLQSRHLVSSESIFGSHRPK